MKSGDLVELSASGKKVRSYSTLKNKYGLVLSSDKAGLWSIAWQSTNGISSVWMKRNHLKILKAK